MTQYIDKDALVAELNKRIMDYLSDSENINGYLKKEFSQWWKSEMAKDYNVDILYERYPNVSMKLAKHFFELGLKVAQNNS